MASGLTATTTNGADVVAFVRYSAEQSEATTAFVTAANLGGSDQTLDLTGLMEEVGLGELDVGLVVLDTSGAGAGQLVDSGQVALHPGQAEVIRMIAT